MQSLLPHELFVTSQTSALIRKGVGSVLFTPKQTFCIQSVTGR